MDIKTEKHVLIEYVTKVNDIHLIEKLKVLVKANERDFCHELSDKQKLEVIEGMDELDRGQKFK